MNRAVLGLLLGSVLFLVIYKVLCFFSWLQEKMEEEGRND